MVCLIYTLLVSRLAKRGILKLTTACLYPFPLRQGLFFTVTSATSFLLPTCYPTEPDTGITSTGHGSLDGQYYSPSTHRQFAPSLPRYYLMQQSYSGRFHALQPVFWLVKEIWIPSFWCSDHLQLSQRELYRFSSTNPSTSRNLVWSYSYFW